MNRMLAPAKKNQLITFFFRNISSEIFAKDLNNDVRKEIEKYWTKKLCNKKGHEKFYTASVLRCCEKIPVEDLRLIAISDSVIRYHQINDRQVYQTTYWQLHQNGVENRCQSFSQLQKMVLDTKHQLEHFHLISDNRESFTNSANSSALSQFIFLRLFQSHLIYQKKTIVDDENSIEDRTNSNTKRCNNKSRRKISQRWFIKTSLFAQNLYLNLCSEKGILQDELIDLHKNWIGKCDGYSFDCKTETKEIINIWVPNLSWAARAEFIVVKPNSLFDIISERDENFSGKLRINAVNPFTDQKLPIYVTENVEYPFGRDTYFGIPSVHENDRKFAESVGLKPRKTDPLELINRLAGKGGFELTPVSSKFNDWPISVSKGCGTPVPIINCSVCGIQPVPAAELPVIPPSIPDGLTNEEVDIYLKTSDWIHTTCPKCRGKAEREKTFIDPMFTSCLSSFRLDEANQLVPLDFYVFGGEKTALHLYRARFLSYILYSLGLLPSPDPCKKWLYRKHQISSGDHSLKSEETDEVVPTTTSDKSVSKIDQVPNDIWNQYGCDASRLFMLLSSQDQTAQSDLLTWQSNLWLMLREFLKIRERPLAAISPWINITEDDEILKKTRNECVRLATLDFSVTHDLNSCLKTLRKLTHKLRMYTRDAKKFSVEFEKTLAALIIMTSPLMPHLAATLWMAFTSAEGRLLENVEEIVWNENVTQQKWPKLDDDYEIPINFRINSNLLLSGGSLRCYDIPTLTMEKALEEGKKSRVIRKFLKQNRILDMNLQTFQNLHAELIITSETESLVEENKVADTKHI